jgi:predicted hotdog family 3-hydroxylacyl-ACP dehydratase
MRFKHRECRGSLDLIRASVPGLLQFVRTLKLPLSMSSALENLLPHRPPMVWIHELIRCSDTEATAAAYFQEGGFPVVDGSVLETALAECVAQTVAAAQGERARRSGTPRACVGGMLAAITDFRVHARAPVAKLLQIEVRELRRFGPMLLVSGEVKCDGELIASGQLSLYA